MKKKKVLNEFDSERMNVEREARHTEEKKKREEEEAKCTKESYLSVIVFFDYLLIICGVLF